MYRENAETGSGSTADAIRHKIRTGKLLSLSGHVQKGIEIRSVLNKLIESNWLFWWRNIIFYQSLGEDARSAGFDAIRYSSERGVGANMAVLKNFDTLLKPQMIMPTPHIPSFSY